VSGGKLRREFLPEGRLRSMARGARGNRVHAPHNILSCRATVRKLEPGTNSMDYAAAAITWFVVWLVFMLVVRMFWLWYFRINVIVAVLDNVASHLASRQVPKCHGCGNDAPEEYLFCPHCERDFDHCSGCKRALGSSFKRCPYCGLTHLQPALQPEQGKSVVASLPNTKAL
jgi:hypothetical protein